MKPDWDKLMGAFADSPTSLVGDVDCTADGKALCDANGVRGYPSIKWGDPADLQDYEGGRDYASLEKFAKESLKPVCSPSNIDLCDAGKKAQIEEYMAMSVSDMEAKIAAFEKKQADAEENFKNEVQKLQDTYQKLNEAKDAALAEVKEAGLGLLKSVMTEKAKSGSDEL